MLRKNKIGAVEIVPFSRQEINAQTHLDLKSMIAQMVEEGVREAMSGKGAELQPFFGSKEIAYEIKRRQTVHEQNKFSYYFEDWGCLICGTRKARHDGCGMCGSCYARVKGRLAYGIRRRQDAKGDSIQPTFNDSLRLAREALAPPMPEVPRKSKRGRG
jgi:7-cyano-7-deazaguanine synthase in queuosine biosynthesis